MWATKEITGAISVAAFVGGLAIAGGLQQLRIKVVRADLAVLQAQVSAANESARISQQKALADTADAQGKIDAIAAELSKALARPARTVDVVRRVSVRLPCPANREGGGAPENQDSPPLVSAPDTRIGAAEYRCFRLDSFAKWRDSIAAERDRLRDGHLAHQALSRALEAATDHIEIVE
ncbi:MAG: hypothetical protein KDA17_05135 [Candidatus Saccharibacteria bacterium]|nr:hypothetical protein [Candidatus Saccharibacteria bacterium]